MYFPSKNVITFEIPQPLQDYSPVLHKQGLLTLADRRENSNTRFLHNLIDRSADHSSLL